MIVRILAVCLVLLASTSANAQGLVDVVPGLILEGITLPGGAAPGNPHAGHFTLGNPTFGGSQAASRSDPNAILAIGQFNSALAQQLATVPIGSSAGGFTFTFDEQSGTYRRGSTSFGPAFSERAKTIGRKKTNIGFNFQHSRFDSYGGLDLDDGSVTFYLPHTDCCSAAAPPPSANIPGFESDLLEAALVLDAKVDTFAAFVNYGVTDRFDVGVAVPISRVSLDATVNATILRLSSSANPQVHTFGETGQDQTRKTFTRSGSASGIGDVIVRAKYALFDQGDVGVAAGVDLRLPTGDEEDLLGIGAMQTKLYGVLSAGNDRLATHVNFGYTVSGETPDFAILELGNEVSYTGGIEYVAHPRLTLVGDILGRTFMDTGSIAPQTKTYSFRPGAGSDATVAQQTSATNPVSGQPYRQLTWEPGNLNVVLGAVGGKFNVAPNTLISGHVLFPLKNDALRDRMTIAFGVDYSF